MTTAWGGQPPNLNAATQTHWGAESIGILGAVMKASWTAGEHGPSPLANDSLIDGLEYRWHIVSVPAGCSITATELGVAVLTTTTDGTFTVTYRLFESGTQQTPDGSVTTYVGTTAAPLTAAVSGVASARATATATVSVSISNPSAVAVLVGGIAAAIAQAMAAIGVEIGDLPVTPRPITGPMVDWDLWAPFILPYAPGCPEATMEHHVRRAAIDFCRATRVWQSDLNQLVGDGASTLFATSGPAESEVGMLLSLTINVPGFAPKPVDILTPAAGMQRVQDGDLRPCAFSDGMSSVVVWPAQSVGLRMTPRAVLWPAVLAAQCPEYLFARHANDIAAGALASLLALPKQDWTDPREASIQAGQFAGRKSTVSLVVQRGSARSSRQSTTRWF